MRRLVTVCHSVIDFSLKPTVAAMGVTKCKYGIVHFISSMVEGLTWPLQLQQTF